jgi:hypothetical protein
VVQRKKYSLCKSSLSVHMRNTLTCFQYKHHQKEDVFQFIFVYRIDYMGIKLNGNIFKCTTADYIQRNKKIHHHTNCSSCISRKHRRGGPLVQKLPFHSSSAYTNHSISGRGASKHPSTDSDRFLRGEFVSFTLLLI